MKAAQGGAATIAITLMLSIAILLSVAFAHRSMLFEVKTSTNQYRAAQAHEAAEAGLEWAIAQLNSDTPIGDDCLPSPSATATPFRERSIATMQARCTEADSGWSCSCPSSGELPAPSDTLAFTVRFASSSTPGLLQLTAMGTAARRGGPIRLHAMVGRLPGLATLPAAALTVRGAASASFGVHHTDPRTGGLTAHSGGAFDTTPLTLTSTPGTPPSASVFTNDPALAHLSGTGLFASVFRMDKAAWRAQPVVHDMGCESDCSAALAQAAATHALIWLRGGLRIGAPVVLGTPERPVLLVVDGPVQLQASTVIHGVIYTTDAAWADTVGATIQGAVIAEGELHANGNTQIHHHGEVLDALHQRTGTYARLPGSWRDL